MFSSLQSGVVQVNRPLDRERVAEYSLTITVKDNPDNPRIARRVNNTAFPGFKAPSGEHSHETSFSLLRTQSCWWWRCWMWMTTGPSSLNPATGARSVKTHPQVLVNHFLTLRNEDCVEILSSKKGQRRKAVLSRLEGCQRFKKRLRWLSLSWQIFSNTSLLHY